VVAAPSSVAPAPVSAPGAQPATEVLPARGAPPSRKAPKNVVTPVSNAPAAAAPVAQVASTRTLPFTGFAVVPVALGGLALIALGLALRFQTRRRHEG
jgi:hypothetical protein